MLEIKNLTVEKNGKIILKNINLKFKLGKIYALIGPNGSGKTTFAQVIARNKEFRVISGKILLNKKNILNMKASEVSKLGIFVSFQNPIEIPGVTILEFIKSSYKSLKNSKISFDNFFILFKKNAFQFNLEKKFYFKFLNEEFSNGEKKKLEIIQMLLLNPKICILDEIESGLDFDSLKLLSKKIKKFFSKNKTIIFITHSKKIFRYIRPDEVFLMINGKIIKMGDRKLLNLLEKKGFKNFKKLSFTNQFS